MKKGELTTQQIVVLIILIASFAVIIFFIVRLNPTSTADNEVCHNSVIMRKSSLIGQSSTPLNCRRDYICLTQNGNCSGLSNPQIVNVKTKEDVYQAMAGKMADCWWMFGEGKIDYVSGDLTHNNYCSICSQVLFDNSLKNIDGFQEGNISKEEIYKYMANNKMPNQDITYLEYIFRMGSWNDFITSVQTSNLNNFGNIEIGKQDFIVMGIVSNIGSQWSVGGSAIGSFAGNFVPIKGATIIGGIVGYSLGTLGGQISGTFKPEIGAIVVNGYGIGNQFMAPTIQEIDSDKFKLLNCQDILTYA